MTDPHASWIAECDRALAAGEITPEQHADRIAYRPLPVTDDDVRWAEREAAKVVPLIQPLDESRLHDALREITGDDTTTVVLIAMGPGYVGVRSFGPEDQVRDAMLETLNDQSEAYRLRQALQQIADFAPGITHGWAEHVRQVARNALKG